MLKKLILIVAVIAGATLMLHAFANAELVDGSWLKAALTPLAALYLDAFNSPATAISLSVGMLIAGFGLLAYYWFGRIAPTLADLRGTAQDIRASRDMAGTEEALAGIDKVLEAHPRIRSMWRPFRATLLLKEGSHVVAPVGPAKYFNMRALEMSALRLRFFLGLPNDFIGIGLMFTFLGLVAGLYFATKSMMSTDLSEARNALVLLLHAATFKFLTSITGIGLSLALSWIQGAMVDRLREALYDLELAFEERLPSTDAARPTQAAWPQPDTGRPSPRLVGKPALRHIS